MSKQTDLINVTDAITVSGSNVGIGTSSPVRDIQIGDNTGSAAVVSLQTTTSGNGSIYFGDNTATSAEYAGMLRYSHSDNAMQFWTSSEERMRIDSSGRAMLGTTTAGVGGAEQFTVASSGNTGITIRAGASSGSAIYMSDATSGSGEYAGYISYSHGSNAMTFASNSSERMRIDSSGNLLVGTTTLQGDGGVSLSGDGYIWSSRVGGASIYANRTTTDGDIIQFRKDGSTVGSIAANGGSIIVGSGDTGLYFDAASDRLIPVNPATASGRDNAVNLGGGSERFKDLYLSGGVYLGGTGSANKLDDYEEGTWTPSVNVAITGTNSRVGKYTKVGRLVTATCSMTYTGLTGSTIAISNLPFTNGSVRQACVQGFFGGADSDSINGIVVESSDTRFYVYPAGSYSGATLEAHFSVAYQVD